MDFIRPFKVHPQRAFTLQETKIPAQRAWTVEETKIPHRLNSASRAPRPRRDFKGAMVVNPSFQQYNEPVGAVHEEDLEPLLMEPPPVVHGPRKVAIKRENINVVRECEWDVKDIKEKTPINGKLVFVLGAVFLTSIVSLVLTLLILFGSVGTRNCSCGNNQAFAGTSAMKSEDNERLMKVSDNITTLDKRLEGRILELERHNEETEQLFHDEIATLHMLMEQQKAEHHEESVLKENQIINLTDSLESTRRELQLLKDQLATQMVAVRTALSNSTTVQLNRLKTVWIAVNATVEKTSNLTAEVAQEFKNVKQDVNETNRNLNRLTSSLQNLTLKIKDEFETVWSNINQSKKCCTDLTTFVKKFKANMTLRSERIEARMESEEQKSNYTQKITDQHLKKIQDVEILLNATRQDAKEISWQHLTALWSAGNRTKKEFQRVWTAMNTSQVVLSDKLRKLKDNLTEQLNLTAVSLQSTDVSLLASLVDVNTTITEKVNNVSKMAGPIGLQGFNGSQGPVGRNGSIGPPGPKGSGDFSACQYKLVTETLAPGGSITIPGLNEPSGKRILGVSCSTNYAAEYNLLSTTLPNNVRRYICSCRGTSKLFSPNSGQQKSCYIHYWECPLTT